jgi:hypothetical protein
MKKVIIILVFFSSNVFSLAEDTVKVNYHYHPQVEDLTPAVMELYRELYDIQDFLDVCNRKITITGNIKNKKIITFTHIVKEEKDSLYTIDTSYFPMIDDTLQITVKSLPVDSNKVKIQMHYGRWSVKRIYDIGNNNKCILMETSLLSNDRPNACGMDYYYAAIEEKFPVIAYSIGIPLENDVTNFCGLRDSGVHPKLWFEKFKIKNYIYFEIKFLD